LLPPTLLPLHARVELLPPTLLLLHARVELLPPTLLLLRARVATASLSATSAAASTHPPPRRFSPELACLSFLNFAHKSGFIVKTQFMHLGDGLRTGVRSAGPLAGPLAGPQTGERLAGPQTGVRQQTGERLAGPQAGETLAELRTGMKRFRLPKEPTHAAN
jgi:hypothetical protein